MHSFGTLGYVRAVLGGNEVDPNQIDSSAINRQSSILNEFKAQDPEELTPPELA